MPYRTPARIGSFHETIEPGAFAESLRSGADVLLLADHDPMALLARTRSGTLRLAESDAGLTFAADMPDTTLAADLLALAERGDLGGASVAFRVKRDRWPSRDRRVIEAAELLEVSIVRAHPAYVTRVTARSASAATSPAAIRARLLRTF